MITPIKKKKIYESVSEQIENLIKSGEWKEGCRVPTEEELAANFNVGRGSVREAIKSLQMSRILISNPGLGTYVADNAITSINNSRLAEMLNDESNMNELIEARYILEPELASMAALNSTPDMIVELQTYIDMMKKVDTKEELIHYGHLFHVAISEMCGNRILINLYKSISEPLQKLRQANFLTIELYQRDIEVHQSILDAIAAKDQRLSYKRMQDHLRRDYVDAREMHAKEHNSG
jgi:GntR family transcriptional repressor for pyruvate dehydrogenase complex